MRGTDLLNTTIYVSATEERGQMCRTNTIVCDKDTEGFKCVQNQLLSLQLCTLSPLCGRFCDLVCDGEIQCVSQQAFLLIGQAWLTGLLAQSINALYLASRLFHFDLAATQVHNCLRVIHR